MIIATACVTDIHAPHLYHGIALPMWILYDHPLDAPNHFVLRLWDGMANTATPYVFLAMTIEGIEEQIEAVPGRFFRMERFHNDDPKIMGVYI